MNPEPIWLGNTMRSGQEETNSTTLSSLHVLKLSYDLVSMPYTHNPRQFAFRYV